MTVCFVLDDHVIPAAKVRRAQQSPQLLPTERIRLRKVKANVAGHCVDDRTWLPAKRITHSRNIPRGKTFFCYEGGDEHFGSPSGGAHCRADG